MEHNQNMRDPDMPAQPKWTNGVGFRHLIEDGIAILQDAPIAPDRRAYVLDDLFNFVLRAKRGSDLVRSNALFAASAERSAVESFSVLDHFLDDTESESWKTAFEKAEDALTQLKSGSEPKEESRLAAILLLQKVLSGLTRESKPGISNQPEELRIGG